MPTLGEQWWAADAAAPPEAKQEAPDGDLLAFILDAYDRADAGPQNKAGSVEAWEMDRILRARSGLESELDRAKANAKALLASLAGRLAAFDWKFKARAQELTRAILERQKGKTYTSLFGKAGFRKAPVRVAVMDPSLVPAEFQRMVMEPDMLKIRASSEVPPGCEVVGGDDRFYMGG